MIVLLRSTDISEEVAELESPPNSWSDDDAMSPVGTPHKKVKIDPLMGETKFQVPSTEEAAQAKAKRLARKAANAANKLEPIDLV